MFAYLGLQRAFYRCLNVCTKGTTTVLLDKYVGRLNYSKH